MASYRERCTFPTLPRTARGAPLVLGADPKGQNILYSNDKTVVIRDVQNVGVCDLYAEHSYPVNVAKYSPTRFYIASGDQSGKVRIWDTINKEHILKNEFHVLGGPIKDIAWDSESKRLAVAGEGKQSYVQCITADSGNTIGDMTGNTKAVNSVAYKPNRPFRIATGSEDFSVQFFEGPPFKRKAEKNDHTNFVQTVRYSPNGEVFITGGSDGKALIYDGKSGDLIGSLGGTGGETDAKAHGGGIYAVDFSPDGSEIMTVSGDKTARIWNVASRELVQEFVLGKEVNDMQLGCLWMNDNIITVSLSGYINFLDRNNPSCPRKIIKGHNKPIMSLAFSEDKSKIFSGASDGQIFCWDINTGICEEVKGKGHTNQIQDMVVQDDVLITLGMDDTIRFNRASSNEYSSDATKMPSLPRSVSTIYGGTTVIACINHVVVAVNGNIMFQQQVKFEPMSVDIHPGGTTVAVGGSDKRIHIYSLSGSTLTEVTAFKCGDREGEAVTDLRYSPDGSYLAAVGTEKLIVLYKYDGSEHKMVNTVKRHTARIDTVAWSPDSQHFATAGLDQDIFVWGVDDFNKMHPSVIHIKHAHKLSQITRVLWLNNNIIVSCGRDSNIKQWELLF